MSRFDKLGKDELSPDEEEQLLNEMLSAKFDAELRAKWDAQLKKKRTGEGKTAGKVVRLSIIWKVMAAAASIAAIWMLVQFVNQEEVDPQTFAQMQLEGTQFLHPGASKGQASDASTRAAATQAFNRKDYPSAIIEFAKIADPNDEDQYYQGLALLLDQQYAAAGKLFAPLVTSSSVYQSESHWYYALSLTLEGKLEEAKVQLSNINSQAWKYDQAQELLELFP